MYVLIFVLRLVTGSVGQSIYVEPNIWTDIVLLYNKASKRSPGKFYAYFGGEEFYTLWKKISPLIFFSYSKSKLKVEG